MFLICYKKECNFFLWMEQPISHGIKGRLSYLPQPQVTRFHPYGEMKEMLKNIAKRLNRKHLSNTSAIHANMTKALNCVATVLMGILHVLCPKNERRFWRRLRCYTLSRERRRAASGVLQVRKRGRASARKLPGVEGFVWKTHWRQTRTFSKLCHHPPKNVKRLKTINNYLVILELLHKMHTDQNVLLYLTISGTLGLPCLF